MIVPTADDEQGPKSLDLIDMELYDDDVLLMVLKEVADNGIEKYQFASFAYTEVDYKLIPSDVIFGQDHGAGHGVDFSMVDFAMSRLVPLFLSYS
ncbi:hypothetical protein BC937DRAFT_94883 [Endogone sp. FLAS-F59071]|nr:hypothetical protein BC937DRAFT_94883 [Endogone sp. FLAS-F59071]|eukprot:RUS13716.1 hypothetical protein BC937DRAFT_94883 [Endogone sp. FLAS-F59071]